MRVLSGGDGVEFDDKCKLESNKRLQSYDWMSYLEKMDTDYHDIISKELPYFADRTLIPLP